MPLFYQNQKIITISASSKKEILKLGRFREENIEMVSPGISPQINGKQSKTPYPSFVYLGRLKPYKNVDVAIKAFAKILGMHPKSKLFIAGNGESLSSLKQLTNKLQLNGTVTFLGKVSEREKFSLLSQSWVALHPSSFEGWGITVLEANACGTPVIASNVQGLRDSVVYRKTGLLVPEKQVGAFASAMDSLITLPGYRKLLSRGALRWSQNFSWEKSAQIFREIIVKELANRQRWPVLSSSKKTESHPEANFISRRIPIG